MNIVDKLKNNPFLGTPENPILFIILVLSAAAFIKQEKLIKFSPKTLKIIWISKIIYEDSNLLAIDKPSGVTVNRSDTTKNEETVQDWTEKYLKIPNSKSQILSKSQIQNLNTQNNLELGVLDLEFARRGGIVHRLDKETSGFCLSQKTLPLFKSSKAI